MRDRDRERARLIRSFPGEIEAATMLANLLAEARAQAETDALEKAAGVADSIAAHIRDEAHALPMGARSGRKTFLANCPAYDVEKFRAELVEDVAGAIRAMIPAVAEYRRQHPTEDATP